VPCEFSQHDRGQADARYTDARTERLHFFATRLKWSRAADVRLVLSEREEALIWALLRALEALGGAPLVAPDTIPRPWSTSFAFISASCPWSSGAGATPRHGGPGHDGSARCSQRQL
jgi:hypothetical protein